MCELIVVALVSSLAGYAFGWAKAHIVIADECRKLGGFYVGRSVFSCTEVKEADHA